MITMVWPSGFSISLATKRGIWSVDPPAAQGTIRLIGRVGFQSAARAGRDTSRDKMMTTMGERKNAGREFEYFTYAPFLSAARKGAGVPDRLTLVCFPSAFSLLVKI